MALAGSGWLNWSFGVDAAVSTLTVGSVVRRHDSRGARHETDDAALREAQRRVRGDGAMRRVDVEGLHEGAILPLEQDDAADGAALRERGHDQDVAVAMQLAGEAIRRARWTGDAGEGRGLGRVRWAAQADGTPEEPEPDVGI